MALWWTRTDADIDIRPVSAWIYFRIRHFAAGPETAPKVIPQQLEPSFND